MQRRKTMFVIVLAAASHCSSVRVAAGYSKQSNTAELLLPSVLAKATQGPYRDAEQHYELKKQAQSIIVFVS